MCIPITAASSTVFRVGTAAPSAVSSVSCLSQREPPGASIFPIAVVTLNNGTVPAVADAPKCREGVGESPISSSLELASAACAPAQP